MARPPAHRRKVNPFAKAQLGVYKGPPRRIGPPKLTPYRVTLLRATQAGEVKAGQGQFTGAWRWHGGTSVTVTKWVREFIGCGWAVAVGAHLELTEAGKAALDNAPDDSCPTGKRRYPTRASADDALLKGAHGKHSYQCKKGCKGWHTTSKPLLSLPGGRSELTDNGEALA